MRVILSRHGNNFLSSNQAYWVGSTHDLALAPSGEQQARMFSDAFIASGETCAAIYCGPLQRTVQYARIILKKLRGIIPLYIDDRLNELDYGKWAGLTTQEIKQQFGVEPVLAWQRYSQWPSQHSGWESNEKEVMDAVGSLIAHLVQLYQSNETVLIISSNGKLRYFLKYVNEEWEKRCKDGLLSVQTGKVGVLFYYPSTGLWKLKYWNEIPNASLFTRRNPS